MCYALNLIFLVLNSDFDFYFKQGKILIFRAFYPYRSFFLFKILCNFYLSCIVLSTKTQEDFCWFLEVVVIIPFFRIDESKFLTLSSFCLWSSFFSFKSRFLRNASRSVTLSSEALPYITVAPSSTHFEYCFRYSIINHHIVIQAHFL